MSEHDNRYEFLKKLGVGFEKLFETVDSLGSEYFSENYPPYNIVKTDDKTYVIQLSMVGYKHSDVVAVHKNGVLEIKAKGSDKGPEAADDIYMHRGIKDGETYIKFMIADGLSFKGAVFEDGLLYITYEAKPAAEAVNVTIKDADEVTTEFIPSSGRVKFDRSGRAQLRKKRMGFRKYQYDSAGRPVAVMDLEDEDKIDEVETAAVLAETKEPVPPFTAVEAEKIPATEEVPVPVVEEPKAIAKKKEETTVEVLAPESNPQIVEAVVKKTETNKVEVELVDATIEVSDDVELKAVPTEKGKADLVVAIKKEDKAVLETNDIDIVETVKEVVKAVDSAPKLPKVENKEVKTVLIDKEVEDKPTVEVTVPVEVTSVVSVKLDEKPTSEKVPAIVIEDSSETVNPEAELVPVVTLPGKPDVIAVIEPEVKEALDKAGANTAEVVTDAIAKAASNVVTSEPVDEKKVEEASFDISVDKVEMKKVTTDDVLVLNKDTEEKATIEVKNEAKELPAVVEVKLDGVSKDLDVPAVVVADATVEVSDNVALKVVKTEEGKSDIVVAATPEVVEELAKSNTTPEEIVAEVVASPELPVAPVTVDAETSDVVDVPVESVTVMVDKLNEEKPTVEVTTPEIVSQIVEVKIKDEPVSEEIPAVELVETAEDISETAELVPVVTPAGQPDMVLAIEPEVKAELEAAGVANTAEVVEKALNQADVIVETPVAVDFDVVDEASAVEEVVEKLDVIAKEPATILVDKEVEDKPTVEVTLAAEEAPQIVEVVKDENPSSEEIPSIIVKDATIEVSDGVELIPVATEEDKSDLVIAIDPELKVNLEESNVDVAEVVKSALETNDAVPEQPVETVTAPVEEIDSVVEDLSVEVPEVVSQIVELQKDGDIISIVDTSPVIASDATLEPVITPPGNPDIVVAVDPVIEEELKESGTSTVEVVEAALAEVNPDVETVVEVDQAAVDAASEEILAAEEPVVEELVAKPVVVVKKPSSN